MSRPRPPQVKARPWQDGGRTIPGIAFMRGQRVLAHMTAAQARNTADKLHDLADELEAAAKPDGKPMANRMANPFALDASDMQATRSKQKPRDSGDKSGLFPRTRPNSARKRGNTAHKAGISAHHPQPTLTAADGTEEPPLPATPAE